MFGSKKSDPQPLGVALDQLLAALQLTTLKAHQDGNTLIVRHEHYTTRIEVIPPAHRESENGPIKAVVRILAELPTKVVDLFKFPEMTIVPNSFAALGALTPIEGKIFVASRLTIYENEDAWNLHFPLLLFTTLGATEGILGAMRRTFSNENMNDEDSEWTESDIQEVHRYLSLFCVCTTDGLGFTAEIGLENGAVSAVLGDHRTALFRLSADQPHPELGGGLLCVLEMPQRIPDKDRLDQICVHLNRMEMAPHDLPPHFGAWCEGRLGQNPAYVSFLPNALHSVTGIAVNASIWAFARAQSASVMLASLGVLDNE